MHIPYSPLCNVYFRFMKANSLKERIAQDQAVEFTCFIVPLFCIVPMNQGRRKLILNGGAGDIG